MAVVDERPAEQARTEQVVPRSALIYIGGLGEASIDQSVEGIAKRVAAELDRAATTGAATFAVELGTKQQDLDGGLRLDQAVVVRSDAGEPTAAVDVWRLTTAQTLTARYAEAGPLRRAMMGGLVFLRYRAKAAGVLRATKGKTRRERRQALLAQVLMAAMVAYLIGLVVVLAASFADASWMPKQVGAALLAVTGLGIWKATAVQRLLNGAMQGMCLLQYLDAGAQANVLRGHLAEVLEHLAELDGVAYERIDVVGYSFGSVVALDATFPASGTPGPRFDGIDTLVTLGCPFDFIRSYWPAYYTQRKRRPGAPAHWLNVYSPLDVFGSDFRDPGTGAPAGVEVGAGETVRPDDSRSWTPPGVAGTEPGLGDVLLMRGLRVHADYWCPTFEQEASALGLVVGDLYNGTPLLA